MNETPKSKQRQTRQRQLILNTLRGLNTHPTADELYLLIRHEMPSLSLGTVYRNLEKLSAEGLVQKIHGEGGSRRYDGDLAPHHHARCRRCGHLEDLPGPLPPPPLDGLPDLGGFEVHGYRLELLGLCAGCRARNQAAADGPATR
jgi:Fur family ferric uptake transcriptional regulator